MRFTNKVVLVTGALSGIGRSIAESFVSEGALVAFHGRSKQNTQDKPGFIREYEKHGTGMYVYGDLTEKQTPSLLIQQVIEQWGKLDILVNSAGMVHHSIVGRITNDDWDKLLSVNLKAPFFLIQESLPYLKKHKGTVINISSLNAIKNVKNNLIYDVTKAGLNQMTSGLALDLTDDGVRLNTVMPAGTATPLLNKAYQQKLDDQSEAKFHADIVKNYPSTASTQQIADIVLFLASAEASWVNGTHIRADGGYHI